MVVNGSISYYCHRALGLLTGLRRNSDDFMYSCIAGSCYKTKVAVKTTIGEY